MLYMRCEALDASSISHRPIEVMIQYWLGNYSHGDPQLAMETPAAVVDLINVAPAHRRTMT
jgi:hypothetical protein